MYENNESKTNRKVFLILGILVGIGGIISYIAIVFPHIFTAILNFLWIAMLLTVAIFLVLGFLVLIGLKTEVSAFLDVILEGSLTIIDAIDLIKKLYHQFIVLLKDFIYFVSPVLAVWLSIMIYVATLFLYKSVSKSSDVTLLTIAITAAMVIIIGVLNWPTDEVAPDTWWNAVKLRFKGYFADSFEIIVFIFFLTMDSVRLFFLPADLQVPIRATVLNYNLMLRAVNVSHQLTVTIFLVTLGISLEILRNVIRLIAVSIEYYNGLPKDSSKLLNIKKALRLGFAEAKDDLIKFIAFTTTLILVFLVFPRLKLFAMVITSLTGLLLDLLIPKRLQIRQGKDLISRSLNKIFNL